MTAGRKPTSISYPAPPAVIEELVQHDLDAARQFGQLQASYGQGRDLVNQLLGQAQMAGASEDFFRTVRTSKIAFVKENKLYRSLAGQKTPHGAEFSGTWEEFCALLGRSVDQVDRDIANLQAFGEEALENMSRMGIGYRDLRQFRRLPADQQSALIEAARQGDKETLLELAEDLIARHAKEKEAHAKALAESAETLRDTEKTLAASRAVVGQKEALISSLQERLAGRAPEAPDCLAAAALRELDDVVRGLVCEVRAGLRQKLVALRAADLAVGEILLRQADRAAIGRVLGAVRQLAQDFEVPLVGPDSADSESEWDAIWTAALADFDAWQAGGGDRHAE